MSLFLLLLFLQEDPVAVAMEKIRTAIASKPAINLARTHELLGLIQNEGTLLESLKKVKEQGHLYTLAAEALAQALENQENRTAQQRKSILVLEKALKRAEKKGTDAEKVGSYRYAFDKIGLLFQLESMELQALVKLGLHYFQQSQFEEAEEALQEVDERLPSILGQELQTTDQNVRLGSLVLAQTNLALGRYEAGGKAARRCIELNPDFGDEEMHCREMHSNQEEYDSYLRKLDEHVGNNPEDLEARFLLGFQLYFALDRKKSKEIFEGIREKKKDDTGAAYFLERLK